MDITQVERGTNVKIINILGGRGIAQRLETMGIIPGRTIRKKSNAPMHGPVILETDTMQVAIGYGMAKKILVEPQQ